MKWSLRKKAVCATLILAFIVAVTSVFISYRTYSATMDDHYRTQTMNVAETVAVMLDEAQVQKYADQVAEIYLNNPSPEFADELDEARYMAQYDPLMDDGYHQIYEILEQVKEANDVRSLYIAYLDPVTLTGVYVVDADSSAQACPMGTWGKIDPQNYEAMKTPENGFPAYITNTKEYGWLCSSGVAVRDQTDGRVIAHVMVEISMNRVMKDRQAYLVRLCLLLLLVTMVLILLFIYLVNSAVVKPINRLALAASSYVSDREQEGMNAAALEQLDIHTGDEVENLCGAIGQMARDIDGYIRNLTAVTAEKERIGAELNVATHIQASMLPCIFPAFPGRSEFDIYACMTPAKEVGGDFYDFFLIDADHLAVVIADVSGKGVPAALFMVIAKTLIKDHVQTGGAPEDVFTEVNRQLCESNDEGLFVTAWMGVLTISTGHMTFVNAGHNPPMVRHLGGDFEYLKIRPGFVLAGMEGVRYKTGELDLAPGDTLFLYTDGVTEATDASEGLYGEERLKAVTDCYKEAEPEQLLNAVKKDIDLFVGDAPQFDDITMLGLKMRKEAGI